MSPLRAQKMLLVAVLVSACGGGGSALLPTPAPTPAATRDGRFIQDIEALATDLPRLHANLFFKVSRQQFEGEVAALKARVPELKDTEVIAGLIRLAALPGDAHTSISPFTHSSLRRLPIRLRFLSDGILVTSTTPASAGLAGGRLVTLGEMPADEAILRVAPLISRSNEAWLRAMAPSYLVVPELLAAQGITADADRVRVRVLRPDGATAEAVLAAVPSGQEGVFTEALVGAPPLYRQRNTENYWFTVTATNIVYVQSNRCQDAATDPMSSFAVRVLAEIDRRPTEAVVIDLRNNGGGNSAVLDPLLAGLRNRSSLAQSGRLFAIVGNSTFSSALLNAITLKRELGAVLVGEPTGGKPNSYGEVRSFGLMNSGLAVSYSTRFFSVWPDGDPESLFPDLAAPISSSDVLSGRDPALSAIESRLGLGRTQERKLRN